MKDEIIVICFENLYLMTNVYIFINAYRKTNILHMRKQGRRSAVQ